MTEIWALEVEAQNMKISSIIPWDYVAILGLLSHHLFTISFIPNFIRIIHSTLHVTSRIQYQDWILKIIDSPEKSLISQRGLGKGFDVSD